MIHTLSNRTVLFTSLFLMILMFVIITVYVNPFIDGGNGSSVIKLQLAFKKEAAIDIVNSWGKFGIANFERWIFTDYLFAISYAFFFASLLSFLILKKGKEKLFAYRAVVYLAFIAGFFDFTENTIELFFLSNPADFSVPIFFIHSVIASIKWAAVPIAFIYILVLLAARNQSIEER